MEIRSDGTVEFVILTNAWHLSLITYFDTYPLAGLKAFNYAIWVKLVMIIKNQSHLTNEGLKEAQLLRSKLNKNNFWIVNTKLDYILCSFYL